MIALLRSEFGHYGHWVLYRRHLWSWGYLRLTFRMALFAEKCTSHVGLDPFDNHPACSDIHTQFQLSLFWKCIWIYSIVVSVHMHLNVKEGLQNNHTSQKKIITFVSLLNNNNKTRFRWTLRGERKKRFRRASRRRRNKRGRQKMTAIQRY